MGQQHRPVRGAGRARAAGADGGGRGHRPRDVQTGVLGACSYDGHLYALVSTPGVVALHYNRLAFAAAADELRRAGLDPDRAPRTLEELDAYADVLTRRDAAGRVTRAGFFPMEPNWYVPYIWMWFGGEIWDSRLRFPGRGVLFGVMLATMMIPFPVVMIPLFRIFRFLGDHTGIPWLGTFKPLWCRRGWAGRHSASSCSASSS